MANPDRKYSLTITKPEAYEPGEPEAGLTLTQLADWFKTDKGTIKHNYTQVYERYIYRFGNLLEIGIACGASLKMWRHWISGTVTGLDIRPECAEVCKGYNIGIIIADATEWIPSETYDTIIDDGSHVSADIVKTWAHLWQYVKPGGLYVVEDLRCTHDKAYIESFEFPKPREDFARRHILLWLDKLMQAMDYRQSDIDFIHYHREMILIGKK